MSPGLTVVVGPPGTGKTDTAVQMVSNLVHTFPWQRTLIITHSNQVSGRQRAIWMRRGRNVGAGGAVGVRLGEGNAISLVAIITRSNQVSGGARRRGLV
jgi:stage III sporulation protein SpoIIIAA